MSIAGFAQRHRAAIYLGVALATLAGLYALVTLPAGIYPEVTYPRIVVIAHAPTFEAPEMTVAVARPLEQALSGTIDLRRIRSRTVRGATELSLDFQPKADIQFALSQVQGRLASLQPTLPPGIDLTAERLTPSVFPMLQYELTGVDPLVLSDLAEFIIRPRLAGVPGVGEVKVQGGRLREISVQPDPSRLLANNLSLDQVAQAVQAANQATTVGRLERRYREQAVVVSGLANSPAAVGRIVVRRAGNRLIRVGDLATVAYGPQDQFQIVSGNGRPAALINIARQPNGNTLAVQSGVQMVMDSIRPLLPRGARVEVVYDQGALVREAMTSIRDAMLLGGALAVAVLLLFLGRWRITLAAALVLPLTLAITFIGLKLTHGSLNLMSLGGLAVAIGLVIDNAVVVVENIERHLSRQPSDPPAAVIRAATDEIFGPVAGSTLTTAVVFAPLGLLEGVVGDFFRAFAIALALAVLLSLALATTLIPALVGHWTAVRPPTASEARARLPHLSLTRLEASYGRVIERLVGHPWLALGTAVALLAAALGTSHFLGTGFLPDLDEGGFILDYWTPPGNSLAETDRQVKILEGILRADPDIVAFTRRTGAELGFAATAPNSGDFTVLLKPHRQRSATVRQVMDRVRVEAERRAPVVRVGFVQLLQDMIGDLAGSPSPVELKLFGVDRRMTQAAAQEIGKAIAPTPGLVDLFDGVAGDNPERRVELDPSRVTRLGLSPEQVQLQARAALFGQEAGSARESDRLVPIRVRFPDSVRFAPDIASTLPIVGPAGWVPLGELGAVRDTADPSELLRENLRPLVPVTGQVEGRSLGVVMQDVLRAASAVRLPAGVSLELGGQYASQRQSFRQLLGILALATGAVLLLLVAQFNGLRGPFAIVLAVPLGLTGSVFALAAAGIPLNVSSFMGGILLVGLIVKNGILLFDAARGRRERGTSVQDALVEAGRLRLRPILMTTLCTLAGLLPLALGWGTGSEPQRPLAIAVIGGLAVSTGVTLLLLPPALEVFGALD